ncbi:MAG: hypothetical protein GY771_04650 [bacterium]|nr:hypothetical protein [bacterium]
MIIIKVSQEQLEEIKIGLNDTTQPYAVACKYGFYGFAGGLDHIEETINSVTIIDRGLSGTHYSDNTTKFDAT